MNEATAMASASILAPSPPPTNGAATKAGGKQVGPSKRIKVGARNPGWNPPEAGQPDNAIGASEPAESPVEATPEPMAEALDDFPEIIHPPTRACVGRMVVFCVGPTPKDVVPAIMVRESKTQPGYWLLKTIPDAAVGFAQRSDVRQSASPRPGYWCHLPD